MRGSRYLSVLFFSYILILNQYALPGVHASTSKGMDLVNSSIISTSPEDQVSCDACTLYSPPTFSWLSEGGFKEFKVEFSLSETFESVPVSVKVQESNTSTTIAPKTWKKVLSLQGITGGAVFWRIKGTSDNSAPIFSQPRIISITPGGPVSNSRIAPTNITTLPTLTWNNNCNAKFKVLFANDSSFAKKYAFSITVQNPAENQGRLAYPLDQKQWDKIKSLVNYKTDTPIFWKVGCFDGMRRYTETQAMQFTLSDETIYENTTRSGEVRSDERWRGVIDVTGDVTVYSPATLTIEPGTLIKFAAGQDDQAGGGDIPITDPYFPNDPYIAPSEMSSICVWDGTLRAIGTPDNRITFTSSAFTPKPGDWHALQYCNAEGKMVIQYTVVEYGYYGIQLNTTTNNDVVFLSNNDIKNIVTCGICSAPGALITLNIANNDISYCGHESISTNTGSNLTIEYNYLHNSNAGIVIEDCMPVVRSNTFAFNNTAIYVFNLNLVSNTTIIDNIYINNLNQNCSSLAGPFLCPDE